jgi:hypothetical protein
MELLLNRFRETLPSPSGDNTTSSRIQTTVHILISAAAINLHSIYLASGQAESMVAVSEAAKSVLDNIANLVLPDSNYVDPILGTVAQLACRALADHLRTLNRMKVLESGWGSYAYAGLATEIQNNLTAGMATMAILAVNNPLIGGSRSFYLRPISFLSLGYQLSRVQAYVDS